MDCLSPDFGFEQGDFFVGKFEFVKYRDGQKAFVAAAFGVHVISLAAECEFVVVGVLSPT